MNPSSQTPAVNGDRPRSTRSVSHRNRRRKWHRLWPQSIPGRLLVMFAVGLLIAQSLTGVLYWSDRQLNAPRSLIEIIGNRVIAIAALVKSTPPSEQPLLLDALNNPLLRVDVVTEPPDYLDASPAALDVALDNRSLEHRSKDRPLKHRPPKHHRVGLRPIQSLKEKRLEQFRTYLTQAITDPVFVMVRPTRRRAMPPDVNRSPVLFPTPRSLLPSRHRLVVVIDQDPQWLVLTLPIGFGSRHHGIRFPVLLLTMGLIIWLLFAWAMRRITDPLLQFATAADRLGLDVNAPPLPEQGSRELRQAAQAFNRMQSRLQRLISDRTFMLAAISHDLRTILTRLRLRTEFMEDTTQQQKVQDDLSQMEIMLNSTLSFAKEESTPEERTTFDLSSLVQSVCDDLMDSGHQVTCDSGDRITLQGQPIALRRAFTNLIANAAIYGQAAEVSVISRRKKKETNSGWVEVAIADRGPGIAPEMREQVFKPFFRLERSRNRETGGTGLGLAVARTVIRRHGGDISLKNYPHPDAINQPDGGLLITVQLPQF